MKIKPSIFFQCPDGFKIINYTAKVNSLIPIYTVGMRHTLNEKDELIEINTVGNDTVITNVTLDENSNARGKYKLNRTGKV
mgnify:CR=1 FL=1